MKKILMIALVLAGFNATAQIKFENASIEIVADTMSIDQGFDFIDTLIPNQIKYFDRYVVKDGVRYYRPGISLRKNKRTYIVKNDGNLILIRHSNPSAVKAG